MAKLAFCGNDCHECPRYIATQSGDREYQKKDYDRLQKAFFEKKQNLDSVHGKYLKKSGRRPPNESL